MPPLGFLDSTGRPWTPGCGRRWAAGAGAPAAEEHDDAPSTPCRAPSTKRVALEVVRSQRKSKLPDLGDAWSLLIPFLLAEGATIYYCPLDRPDPDDYEGHFHTVCCTCKREDTNIIGAYTMAASSRSARSVFYGCEDCNQCRVLNVLSKSWRALCRPPIQCGYCENFEPLHNCKHCAEIREEVREGELKLW